MIVPKVESRLILLRRIRTRQHVHFLKSPSSCLLISVPAGRILIGLNWNALWLVLISLATTPGDQLENAELTP